MILISDWTFSKEGRTADLLKAVSYNIQNSSACMELRRVIHAISNRINGCCSKEFLKSIG